MPAGVERYIDYGTRLSRKGGDEQRRKNDVMAVEWLVAERGQSFRGRSERIFIVRLEDFNPNQRRTR
jgi:hypothetical protein